MAWPKGRKHSAETKRKMSVAHKGKSLSEAHKRKLSEVNRGVRRQPHSVEEKRHLSKACSGWHQTQEVKDRISKAMKGRAPWLKGRNHSEESKRQIGEANQGENNGNWQGGHPRYRGIDWHRMRQKTYRRDNYRCVLCGAEDDLAVHHHKPIRLFEDPNDANSLSNLMLVCRTCHARAEITSRRIFGDTKKEDARQLSFETVREINAGLQ